MTDVSNEEIQLPRDMTTRDMFFYFRDQVGEIDQRLNAGSPAAMRAATEKELIAAYEFANQIPVVGTDETEDVSWKNLSDQIVGMFSRFDERVLSGLYFGLITALENSIGKTADEYLTSITPAPSDQDKLKDDEKQALGEQRQNYMKQLKMLKDLNLLMKFATEAEMVLPQPRPGLGGTRKREISQFQWFVDGVQVPADRNKVKIIAEEYGGYKNQELFKNALMEHLTTDKDKPRKDLRDLPDLIPEMEMVNGKKLVGKRFEVTADTPAQEEPTAENEDDDDDDDDDEEEEVVTSE